MDDIFVEEPLRKLLRLFELTQKPGDGIAETCRILANELGNTISPKQQWGWQYIHQVLHKKLAPSRKLLVAIDRLYFRISRAKRTELEVVPIIAPVGFVHPQTFLSIHARQCAWHDCNRTFIPTNPNHRYCSSQCRELARRNR